jgi:hypothetical protein
MANQNAANSVDTGFYAKYSLDAGTTTKYAGLFKDASDSDTFKLFRGLEVEPTTTINTGGTGYALADLDVAGLSASSGSISGDLIVDTNTLYVDSADNRVGIGTVSPDTLIHGAASTGATLRLESTTTTLQTGGVLGAIEFETQDSGSEGINAKINSVFENTVGATSMQFFTSAAFATITSTPQMVIDSSGNVGIGTTSPAVRLEIEDSGANLLDLTRTNVGTYRLAISGDDRFSIYDVGADEERLSVDSSGNVGIGTTSPVSVFHTKQANATILVQDTDTAFSTTQAYIKFSGSDASGNFRSDIEKSIGIKDNSLVFEHVGSETMRIDSSGNVGINDTVSGNFTTNYDTKLLVGGEIIARSLTANESMISIGGDSTSAFVKAGKQDGSLTARQLRFEVGSTEAMRIDSSGVTTLTAEGYQLAIKDESSGNISEILTSNTAMGFFADRANAIAGTSMIFSVDNDTKMTIDSSGRVGIGVTPNAFSSTGGSLSIGSQGNIGNGYKVGSLNFITGDSTFTGNYPDGITGEIASVSEGAAGARYDMVFLTADGDGSNSRGERMRIDSSGVSKFTPTKAYGDTSSSLKIFGAFTGTNYSDGSYFNLVFGDDDATNSYMGSITVKQLNASSSTATEMLFYTNAGGGNSAVNPNMVIDSSGNVGIGTDSPAAKLEIEDGGTTSNVLLKVTADDQNLVGLVIGNDSATGGTTDTNGLRQFVLNDGVAEIQNRFNGGAGSLSLNSNGGNVGIGTTNPQRTLDVNGEIQNTGIFRRAGVVLFKADGTSMKIGSSNASGGDITFHTTANLTSADERMRITSGGQVRINKTSSGSFGSALQVQTIDGSNILELNQSGTGNYLAIFTHGSTVVGAITENGTSTSYGTTSDYRLKENVVPMNGALDRVDALKPSRFNFIADADKTVDGFLAHEVAEVVPEAISGEKDAVDEEGNAIYQGIDQSKLVPLLVGAIQELKAEIETLKSQIQ